RPPDSIHFPYTTLFRSRAHQYRLNRDHLAAKWIEKLSALRLELIAGLRATLQGWRPAADLAILFGSVARGRGDEQSDVDILLVRSEEHTSELQSLAYSV